MENADRDRVEAVFARLQQAVTDLVSLAEARIDERCPYRGAADACTFAGGCQNQRRPSPGVAAAVGCGGDHALRGEPHDEP